MATPDEYQAMGVTEMMSAQPFSLPPLPYSPSALEPYIGTTTMMTHYGKHHVAYLKKLNELVQNTEFATMQLEEVVKKSSGGMFNQAAQAWNHNFFWKCMTPTYQAPNGPAYEAIIKSFGSYEKFQAEFLTKATGQFGSGWAWLTKTPSGELVCESTPNGVNPVSTGSGTPMMGLDVWEHAYYLDYKQDRAGYVKNWFNLINWDFVNENYNSA